MEISSKWKESEILFSYFPFDVSALNSRGLYMNDTAYLIYKFIMCGAWTIIFVWQITYWKLKILMYLTTWNIILGFTYNISSVIELVFMKSLQKYKLWRINHFIFTSHAVVSIVILIFDSSLISRTYLEYTNDPQVATLLFYSSSLMPTVLSIIQLALNSVVITNYRSIIIYGLVGGPYFAVMAIYTLLVEPVYKQITFTDQHSFVVLLSTVVITGMSFMLVRIYCEIFKIDKTISLLAKLVSKQLPVDDRVIVPCLIQGKRQMNMAYQVKTAGIRKPPLVRANRQKKMLPSLKKVFTSIITNDL